MVASESDDFLDMAGDSLQEEGAVVICVGSLDGAIQALEDGFRPEVLVVDGALRFGSELVARVRETTECQDIPVFVVSPVRGRPDDLSSPGTTVVKRNGNSVVEAVQALYFGSA